MEKPPKKLPQGVSKTELVNMYKRNSLSRRATIRGINLIIVANRLNKPHWEHYTEDKLKAIQVILPNELREFVAIYGLPEGYYE